MDIFTCYPVYTLMDEVHQPLPQGTRIRVCPLGSVKKSEGLVILCQVCPYNNNEGLGSPFGMNRIGGITMQQKKESNHTEVISIEEYLTKRKRLRDLDQSQKRGGIPKENHALVLMSCLVGN